ncbi:hypothetical protein CYMTET_17573 [Cymbomonas tetramitiformis]|uniref:Uncharacterized protein n=1 Tax=Cymbomonas tetramitiformis TaxID=36881 RepID=A0AAE0G9W8_9CHLO|nr:hypothetical protein CYMTET_17573 [Cymbomonas tetramitiformis]
MRRAAVDKVWQARECGDGYCDEPLEFPAFGSLGCRVDCGLQRTLVPVLIVIHTDLTRLEGTSEHMQELWRTVRWNLCTRRTHATVMHLQPLCWYSEDRHLPRYSSRAMTTSEEFELPPGRWYIRILGDFTQSVQGAVYDMSNVSDALQLPTSPAWEACVNSEEARDAPPPGRRALRAGRVGQLRVDAAARRDNAPHPAPGRLGVPQGGEVDFVSELPTAAPQLREPSERETTSAGERTLLCHYAGSNYYSCLSCAGSFDSAWCYYCSICMSCGYCTGAPPI